MRNDGWEIDGVGKHTYNLELACKLMGEAEEEAPLLPYFPHFRRLLRRAESFLLPSPCPVYTLAISYTEGPRRIKATFWGYRAGGSKGLTVMCSGQKEDGWARSPHWHRRNKNLQPVSWKGCCVWLWNQVLKRWRRVDPGRRGSWETALVRTDSEPTFLIPPTKTPRAR